MRVRFVDYGRSWSRLVSNYLALPFMRPFLNGVPRPNTSNCNETVEPTPLDLVDLVTIIEKIRGLRYESVEDYVGDLETILKQTIEMSIGKDTAIVEAVETLLSNGRSSSSLQVTGDCLA